MNSSDSSNLLSEFDSLESEIDALSKIIEVKEVIPKFKSEKLETVSKDVFDNSISYCNIDDCNRESTNITKSTQNFNPVLYEDPSTLKKKADTEIICDAATLGNEKLKPLIEDKFLTQNQSSFNSVRHGSINSMEASLKEPYTLKDTMSSKLSLMEKNISKPESTIDEMNPIIKVELQEEQKINNLKKDGNEKSQQQSLECESGGSPRIILKIAKSAITDCSEPRSPKSPKIHSFLNSPSSEDLGQKYGKIKLKLSKGTKMKISKSTELDEKNDELHKLEELRDKLMYKSEEGRKSEALKIKLLKVGDASIVSQDCTPSKDIFINAGLKEYRETNQIQDDSMIKKQEPTPIGMKIKLSKTGDAKIICQEKIDTKKDDDSLETLKRHEMSLGMKIKFSKAGDASVVSKQPLVDIFGGDNSAQKTDSLVGVKIKLTKMKSSCTTASLTKESSEESNKRLELMETNIKNKSSNIGGTSVINSQKEESFNDVTPPIGMKIKLSKTKKPSIINLDEIDKSGNDIEDNIGSQRYKNHNVSTDIPLYTKDDPLSEIKIKLDKPVYSEDSIQNFNILSTESHNNKGFLTFEELPLKELNEIQSNFITEPLKNQTIPIVESHVKRKEITFAPLEMKKMKLASDSEKILSDISDEPKMSEKKNVQVGQSSKSEAENYNSSHGQINVINEEISITQISSKLSSGTTLDNYKILTQRRNNHLSSPVTSDCEIIEPNPEFIMVNENSSSSQDIMIIEEVKLPPEPKIPKKRGRPRRNTNLVITAHPSLKNVYSADPEIDPLSLCNNPLAGDKHSSSLFLLEENSERPRRTCRNQKSYAPPKRGRGRGRAKRKDDCAEICVKKSQSNQDLTEIERAATAIISLKKLQVETACTITNSPELFKVLNEPALESSNSVEQADKIVKTESYNKIHFKEQEKKKQTYPKKKYAEGISHFSKDYLVKSTEVFHEQSTTPAILFASNKSFKRNIDNIIMNNEYNNDNSINNSDSMLIDELEDKAKKREENFASNAIVEISSVEDHQNWIAPSKPKIACEITRSDPIISLSVIDEDTRMSADSSSRSQTPARNIIGTSEAVLNDESQGSSATTESERVKVQKNRRMEINFDPDEGPFTIEKIAEYEWPKLDNRPLSEQAETYMIQEQISHYLGVKSFKRKYPDLKRRTVEMEERNFLRENGLVSESMCDMGLTAVSSSEVLDIMCSDFPEQYEEYRKHLRDKVAKEHSKKQKELTAATNAERNRMDLTEMAIRSALSWNASFNKLRKELRTSSLDLQTFTVQIPKRKQRINKSSSRIHYPVALVPEQYTDYYKAYTPTEIRYFPVNTVLYGSLFSNEKKMCNHSEFSQSDSDTDSSSDDSSSSSSVETHDTEGSLATLNENDMDISLQLEPKCKLCHKNFNKNNSSEVLIQCGTCNGNVHPSCMDLSVSMVPQIRTYAWQCTDCKTCAQCHDPADEDKMLFCDMCDRGYHIYCVGLRRVPQGRWHCQECAVCSNCGSKEPGGIKSETNSAIQWQHEYKKVDKNSPQIYVSTFCIPCFKLRGN